jgi:hypothetical protein
VNWTIQFQWTYEEFREGLRAIRLGGKRDVKAGRGIFGWVLFIGLAVMLFVVLQSNKRPPGAGASPGPTGSGDGPWYLQFWVFVPGGVFVAFLIAFAVAVVRGGRRAFDREPIYHRMHTVHIGADGISLTNAVEQTSIRWEGYVKFGESANVFLLFTSKNSAQIIPKRAFATPADVEEFRAYATARIAPPTSAFPVLPPKAG